MENITKHAIIFSHGFGVKKDDRGLFTDIAEALAGAGSVMFDYNEIDDSNNQITVRPFSGQVAILEDEIRKAEELHPGATIDIVAHSQGSIIAALADLSAVRKVIMIAPPFSSEINKTINHFKAYPGTEINIEGLSKLSRKDGSVTIVPSAYWEERKKINPLELYEKLSQKKEVIIINASRDEVLGENPAPALHNVKTINLEGDHNFSGESRKNLIDAIRVLVI